MSQFADVINLRATLITSYVLAHSSVEVFVINCVATYKKRFFSFVN
jgi:hypothetical protein